MNKKCIYLVENEKCEKKCKYGNYCYKHRSNHLLDSNKIININNFTGISKDYLKSDIILFYKKKMKKKYKAKNKELLFNEIKDYITMLSNYKHDNNKIIKVQSLFRRYSVLKRNNTKCNNNEDFYTYELLSNIPTKYFYKYKDIQNIYWGFDIRSLEKLLEFNIPNPYTMESISEEIIEDVNKRVKILKDMNNYEDYKDTIDRDRKETIKQKTVDLFSLIEQHGYSCNVEWFTSLSIRRLKELYKQLEDIWNYRLGLSEEYKRVICPPDGGAFTIPLLEIINYNCKEDLQELILHEIFKFNNCEVDSDRKMGYFYFIIGLGYVSPQCYNTHADILDFIN